ncbi:MAG TPA: 50S ribosomal protein L17 [Thermodesulfobacteriaceae bacterium]|nr:50S ribosomal protein L17 [Thermodesulfobacteriaceae bacterium]
MRHRRRTRRLGCKTAHRKAMLRNMVTSLLDHGRIMTTVTRAKEVRRIADRMVTLAKDGTLHARRQAMSVVRDPAVVAKLFDECSDKYGDRNGGYTRIVRIGPRRGDAAMMSVVEMVSESLEKPRLRSGRRKKQADSEDVTLIPQAPSEIQEEKQAVTSTEEQEEAEVGEGLEQTETSEAAAEEGAGSGPSEEEATAGKDESDVAAEAAREKSGEEEEENGNP